jgi:hypothetical protein
LDLSELEIESDQFGIVVGVSHECEATVLKIARDGKDSAWQWDFAQANGLLDIELDERLVRGEPAYGV